MPGRRRRNFPASNFINACCCRSTIIISRAKSTDYLARPNVEYAVRGSNAVRSAETWPPPGIKYTRWFLNAAPSGSVTSLNDGGLAPQPADGAPATSYKYPNPGWVAGVVGFGPTGLPAVSIPRAAC